MEENKNKGQWFVIHTLSGKENKVRESIQRQIKNDGDSCPIYEAHIPVEKVSEVRGGKKITTIRKFFPGYILVRMDLYDPVTKKINEAAWYYIRNIQGVISFVGGGQKPVPLSASEVAEMFRQDNAEEEKIKPKVLYEIGENVRIKDGAFENFEGTVEEIDNERGKLKLMVSIFGRSTPVELEFWQVDRDI
ncbi:MAG: transcription termination/antitermination protein NusG [Victivallaceae bacterium]|jgi:transcriptional antiterminator NusG|nr:transcription termination/antitermination protein NusG [Victivallaceae bacterium]NLK83891.1 transcription termination/antitermination factor NusG [Lentisphaerota bacterium]MDD3116308.1 transcription termination/antitermination protein NusG [Victivallaceae bacterium]MDD3703093.1 transcription termination/antitermination protein NusG [Victivallaceae bacterium]MDD4316995.1 transcription termination/antitermination protein NusG [Victivallaceae bacterium]